MPLVFKAALSQPMSYSAWVCTTKQMWLLIQKRIRYNIIILSFILVNDGLVWWFNMVVQYVQGDLGALQLYMHSLIPETVLTCNIYMHGIGSLVMVLYACIQAWQTYCYMQMLVITVTPQSRFSASLCLALIVSYSSGTSCSEQVVASWYVQDACRRWMDL